MQQPQQLNRRHGCTGRSWSGQVLPPSSPYTAWAPPIDPLRFPICRLASSFHLLILYRFGLNLAVRFWEDLLLIGTTLRWPEWMTLPYYKYRLGILGLLLLLHCACSSWVFWNVSSLYPSLIYVSVVRSLIIRSVLYPSLFFIACSLLQVVIHDKYLEIAVGKMSSKCIRWNLGWETSRGRALSEEDMSRTNVLYTRDAKLWDAECTDREFPFFC